MPQHRQFLGAGRLGDLQIGRERQRKAGVGLHLLAAHAGIERDGAHAPRLLVEVEDGEIGHDAEHAAGAEAAFAP